LNSAPAISAAAATSESSLTMSPFFHLRQNFHSGMLVDRIGRFPGAISLYPGDLAALTDSTRQQAFVMANADSYLMLGALAVLLIPFVLRMDYVAAPARKSAVALNSSAKG
jgi:MFS transporter, DHA2 family, multidrug resistance protein